MKRLHLLPLLNLCPPMLCRLLARKRRGTEPMTTREIASISRLAPSTVDKLSHMTEWRRVTIGTYQAFTIACGVNPLSWKTHRDLLKRRKAVYWRNATISQRRMINRITGTLSERHA